jgi:ribonuclease P protein component
MLGKRERLSRTEIEKTLKLGRRITGPLFDIVYLPSSGAQVSIVVGKKVSLGAVGRHLIRRRLFGALKTLELPPFSLVILTKKPISTASYDAILGTVEEAIGRITKKDV